MQYMVTGMDGKEYGPTDIATLKTWVAENRLAPHTMLRDFNSGQTMPASAVPGLFAATSQTGAPPVGAPYPRAAGYQAPVTGDYGKDALGGVIFRCVLALALAFFLSGAGLITSAYALYYAFQCKQSGSRHGTLALALAGGTLLVVIAIFAVKQSMGHGTAY